jgi:hypothetical protein
MFQCRPVKPKRREWRNAILHGASTGRHDQRLPPLILGAELLELCPHCRKSALEEADDLVSNLGRRKSCSVYESTPTIDFVLRANDYLIGIVIHGDEALGLRVSAHRVENGLVFLSAPAHREFLTIRAAAISSLVPVRKH